MHEDSERLHEIVARLSEKGFRVTPQRMAVLRILADSKEHLKIEEIYSRVSQDFPMTSLATIYNTISMLKEIDEVLELSFGDGGKRYDGNNPEPHPHLLCECCGSVIDPDIPTLNNLMGRVADLTGYQVTSQRLDFFGICPLCQKGFHPDS